MTLTYEKIVSDEYAADETTREWPERARKKIYELAHGEMPEDVRDRFPIDCERMYSLSWRGAMEEALDASGRKRRADMVRAAKSTPKTLYLIYWRL